MSSLRRTLLQIPDCKLARVALLALLALPATGCANSGQLDPAALATGALESIPAAAVALAAGTKVPKGSPMEIYTRIARGAHSCWLGGPGDLRKTHDFHAVSVPRQNNKGGQSKIIIYRRPAKTAPPEQKGTQAFRVRIDPQGESAVVEAQNLKFPKEVGEQMVADAHRWASGEEGCVEGGVKEGWGTQTDTLSPSTPKKSRKVSIRKK